MKLTQIEANTMLNGYIVPQMTYIMQPTQFTRTQCHKLDATTLQLFLLFSASVMNNERVVITNNYVGELRENLTMVNNAAVHMDTFKVSSACQLYKEQGSK